MFKAHTNEELQKLNIKEDEMYTIEYMDRDYFNGEEKVEVSKAKAILNNTDFIFVVSDPYGMDKYIKECRVIK